MMIVDFLNARINEDEQAARAATPAPWSVHLQGDAAVVSPGVAMDREEGGVSAQDATHMVRHDPARVLREIEAKRGLIASALAEKHVVVEDSWYTCPAATEENDGGECGNDDMADGPCECGRDARVDRLFRQLAAVYTDHPDYQEEWRP
ncbi:DUF6221 family protein [Nocardiopsis sp. NPDC049922]|uniref:DUF6221 family protein n=1 Tax=Nocardiopsis sp. NPDC049922 TaxID=3155157 RepID=UPI0033DEBFE7